MPYVLSSCSKTMVQKKGEGGIVLSLQPIDDEVKLHDSEHAEALGQKNFLVLCGWKICVTRGIAR